MIGYYIIVIFALSAEFAFSDELNHVTQTVYGFLDFTTTIGNTVMVFSPQSAPKLSLDRVLDSASNIIKTNPITTDESILSVEIDPTITLFSNQSLPKISTERELETLKSNIAISTHKSILSDSTKESLLSSHPVNADVSRIYTENNLYTPEYDLLFRQPAEFIEETFRVIDHKTISNNNSKRGSIFPKRTSTLIHNEKQVNSKLSGTGARLDNDSVHKSVLLSSSPLGKHVRVLQTTSHNNRHQKPKIRPTSSLRLLKTAAPSLIKSKSNNEISSRHLQVLSHNTYQDTDYCSTCLSSIVTGTASDNELTKNSKKHSSRGKTKRKHKGSRNSVSHQHSSTHSLHRLESSTIRPKPVKSSTGSSTSTSLYTFKLNRTPGRWQYKTSPKPRVNIRKTTNDTVPLILSKNIIASTALSIQDLISEDNVNQDLLSLNLSFAGSQKESISNSLNSTENNNLFLQTLNVEISTPDNFKDTYYEIATIKSPLLFQAGALQKTKFVTITSTIEKTLASETASTPIDGPLIENIIDYSSETEKLILDGSFTTLFPMYLKSDDETPELETVTESFTSTQVKLKTQILPIIRKNTNETTYVTLVQTYDITNFITATKTIIPYMPLRKFKDFGGLLDEAGSEINLELEFGDEDNDDVNISKLQKYTKHNEANNNENTSILANKGSNSPIIDVSNAFKDNAPLSASADLETIWETYVVPIINGQTTVLRTISKSVGVIENPQLNTDTKVFPSLPPPLPTTSTSISVNPFLLPVPQQFHTITTSVVHQTNVIQTKSQILKLTFGAKTAYTTLLSTEVVPTTMTMFITTSVPVQPPIQFPGYYPQPYPPFGYVG